jgi:hypothetical protein
MLDDGDALVFVDNHDNQRGGANIITYKQSKLYKVKTPVKQQVTGKSICSNPEPNQFLYVPWLTELFPLSPNWTETRCPSSDPCKYHLRITNLTRAVSRRLPTATVRVRAQDR